MICRGAFLVLAATWWCRPAAAADGAELASKILEYSGVKGGIVVHLDW